MSTKIDFSVYGALKRGSTLEDVTAEINATLEEYNAENVNFETSGDGIDLIRVSVNRTLDEDFTTLSDDRLTDTYKTIMKISDLLQTINVTGTISNDVADRPDCTIFKQSNGVIRVEHSRVIEQCDSCNQTLQDPYVKMFPSSGRALTDMIS